MEDAPRVKRVLVTGGTGAVGSYLVPELRSRGHETWVLDRGHHEAKDYIRCDVGEYRQLEADNHERWPRVKRASAHVDGVIDHREPILHSKS